MTAKLDRADEVAALLKNARELAEQADEMLVWYASRLDEHALRRGLAAA